MCCGTLSTYFCTSCATCVSKWCPAILKMCTTETVPAMNYTGFLISRHYHGRGGLYKCTVFVPITHHVSCGTVIWCVAPQMGGSIATKRIRKQWAAGRHFLVVKARKEFWHA